MRRAAVVIAIASMTVAACDNDCLIEHVVAQHLEGIAYVDCGDLSFTDEATLRAAHDCAVANAAANQPFAVIFDLPSDEARRAQGYAGVPVEAGLELRWFYYDAYHGEDTLAARCRPLTDLGACTLPLLAMNLCFSCDAPEGLDTCRQ